MDKSIPQQAAKILDFIATKEAPQGYNTVFGNNQRKMPKQLISMTFDEVVEDGPRRTKAYGSSACGRYQFMRDTLDKPGTLADLKGEMGLTGKEKFTPDLQDRMGFHLLKRRGYDKFINGRLSVTGFGLNLAKEWASFPVLRATKGAHRQVSRGQSYYTGDSLNKALVSADEVENVLNAALKIAPTATPILSADPAPSVEEQAARRARPTVGGFLANMWARVHPGAKAAVASPTAPVTKGDPVVFSVQTQLKERGYYQTGFLDGLDGPKTRDAVAAIRKDNGMGDGGIDNEFLARLPTFGKAPISAERANADFAVVKAHAPDLAAPVGTFWKLGAGLLGLGGADAANQGGLLDSLKNVGDQTNDALATVNSAFATVASIVQFIIGHWQWIAIIFGIYYIIKAASFALDLIIKFKQARF